MRVLMELGWFLYQSARLANTSILSFWLFSIQDEGASLSNWKNISEICKNFVEIFIILGGLFAWLKWLRERHNRAVDVLAELETKFTRKDLKEARSLIESDLEYKKIAPAIAKCVLAVVAPGKPRPTREETEPWENLDPLLRFYVYLCGVRNARQVPESSLRACYRYWLTFYFNTERTAFRAYVDWFYPTVSAWLRYDEAGPGIGLISLLSRFGRKRKRFFDPAEFGWVATQEEKRQQLRRAIKSRAVSTRVLVITGAGISAESGLPTFRGKEGYWRNRNPKTLATRDAFEKEPAEVWQFYRERRKAIRESSPNAAHNAIVQLTLNCTEFLLVTQNVDDLHDRASFDQCKLSQNEIVHIHGQIFSSICSKYGRTHFQRWDMEAKEDESTELPKCPNCGSLLRPDVVWFDEDNDPTQEQRVEQFLSKPCDVVLVIGTSATFEYIRRWALEPGINGAWLIEINPHETPLSRFAHYTLRGPAGKVLPKLMREAMELGPIGIG